ncbi:hypothetical protein N7488_003796 [Penicillium malachiteum]|nr:hypothetical protein N7488_003796 [Penicillium malachiteum]
MIVGRREVVQGHQAPGLTINILAFTLENTLRGWLANNDLPEQWCACGTDLHQLLLIELLIECDEETLLLLVMVLQSHQDLLRDLMTTTPPDFTRLNGDLLPKATRFDNATAACITSMMGCIDDIPHCHLYLLEKCLGLEST